VRKLLASAKADYIEDTFERNLFSNWRHEI